MACCNRGSLQRGYFCTLGLTPSHHRRQGATLPWEIIIIRRCHRLVWNDKGTNIRLSQYQSHESQVRVVTLITLLSSDQRKRRTINVGRWSFIKSQYFIFSLLINCDWVSRCLNCSDKPLMGPVVPINYLLLQFTWNFKLLPYQRLLYQRFVFFVFFVAGCSFFFSATGETDLFNEGCTDWYALWLPLLFALMEAETCCHFTVPV